LGIGKRADNVLSEGKEEKQIKQRCIRRCRVVQELWIETKSEIMD